MKSYKRILGSFLAITGIVIALVSPMADAAPSSISRISIDTGGGDSNASSSTYDISEDGRYVLFSSGATDLVSGDTNGKEDMFVRDTVSGTTELISVDSSETQANNNSNWGKISSDGRYVVFRSSATNLVSGDTNAATDVFLRDRTAGTTTLISKNTSGSVGNGQSEEPEISNDGRFVVFSSYATDLVSGDTNSQDDVFVRDIVKGTTTRISVSEGGTQGDGQSYRPKMSCDGRYIAFNSASTNLVSGDTNGYRDTFLYDSMGGLLTNITLSATGGVSDPNDISCDGSKILISTNTSNLISGDTNNKYDLLMYDTSAASFTRVTLADDESQSNNDSLDGSMSGDGRYISFYSSATNLVSGDSNAKTDIFLRDTSAGTTKIISSKADGTQSNGNSFFAYISKDGTNIALYSEGSNLVASDGNATGDIFLAATGNSPVSCY